MGTYRQTLLYNFSTLVTFLACETRVHSYHLMPSTCSPCSENIEECAPTGVHDGFGKAMVFHHCVDVQVFYHNMMTALSLGLRRLEMMVSTLPIDLQMGFRHVLCGLTAAMAALLSPCQLALLVPEYLL